MYGECSRIPAETRVTMVLIGFRPPPGHPYIGSIVGTGYGRGAAEAERIRNVGTASAQGRNAERTGPRGLYLAPLALPVEFTYCTVVLTQTFFAIAQAHPSDDITACEYLVTKTTWREAQGRGRARDSRYREQPREDRTTPHDPINVAGACHGSERQTTEVELSTRRLMELSAFGPSP